jgi:hypothetical protein
MIRFFLFLLLFVSFENYAQEIALLKYNGGGDWYANPTSLPNLIRFCNTTIATKIKAKPSTVTPDSPDLFSYPCIHATGHGNIVFNESEIENMQKYLESGGFLHIDDNYGMDQYIRREIKKLFPNQNLIEIPSSHSIFQKPFAFANGLPKIHEHDGKRPQAFGIFINNRLTLLYTYECDLGDGWEDEEVHNDPEEVHQKALKMGANIIHYAFNN